MVGLHAGSVSKSCKWQNQLVQAVQQCQGASMIALQVPQELGVRGLWQQVYLTRSACLECAMQCDVLNANLCVSISDSALHAAIKQCKLNQSCHPNTTEHGQLVEGIAAALPCFTHLYTLHMQMLSDRLHVSVFPEAYL